MAGPPQHSFLTNIPVQVVDMPLRWHGAAGHFTKEFEMNVPGAKAVEVNQYRCRSLNVMQTKSKVRMHWPLHRLFYSCCLTR